MKKMFKQNRVFTSLMLVSLVCFIIMLVVVYIYFFSTSSKNKYGDRLGGINEVKVKESKLKEIEDTIGTEKNVKSISIDLQGKIFYVIVYLNDESLPVDGVNASNKVFTMFEDKEKAFYDFQFIITKKELQSSDVFPIMGYKNAESSSIIWTNYAS